MVSSSESVPAGPPAGLNGFASRLVKGFRIRAALGELAGARSILDLGCGLCEIVPRLPLGIRYVGVEREPWMLGRARRIFPEHRFLGGDLERGDFDPGGGFERILLLAVWEHLRDPEGLLRRAVDWAAPAGRMIISTPAPRAHALLETGSRLGFLSRHADEEHERLWEIGEVAALATRSGWAPVQAGRFLFGLNQLVVLERPGPGALEGGVDFAADREER